MGGVIIPVLTRTETAVVKKEDVLYVESRLRTVLLHTAVRRYRYYGKMGDLAEMLGGSFYRCHVSWIVNLCKVASAGGGTVHMEDGKDIFLGRNKFQAFRRRYIQYLAARHKTENS
ncbi:MAG: LytTR family transcriptional regulator DNA-binding domain-containing protein [Clostridiales Family XIII bacterium]|jgi:DNA-binding LytR/AlgR family response regulator|nr:LytTR family transcriptional regulator DNA-binding domain-containing protein [Clostridiales Family XIII bacterium]